MKELQIPKGRHKIKKKQRRVFSWNSIRHIVNVGRQPANAFSLLSGCWQFLKKGKKKNE